MSFLNRIKVKKCKKGACEKVKKALPSGSPFFVMKEMDWGTHPRSKSDCTEYYIYADGQVEYQFNGYVFKLPLEEMLQADANDYWSGLRTKKMSDENFLSLCSVLKKFPENHARMDCYDGVGYTMTMYDVKGNIIHTTSGYIYGNEILEKIRNLIVK